MGKILICSDEPNQRARFLQQLKLPANYMGDFSKMGFVVNHYSDALQLLSGEGYQLKELDGATELLFDSPAELRRIQHKLSGHGITCLLTDIADSLYQA